MEREEVATKDEALKLQIALRCAKAALMLSSLKSLQNHSLKTTDNEDEEREMLLRAIANLKIELLRESSRRRQIKLCSLMEVFLQILLVLSLWSFSLILAFRFE